MLLFLLLSINVFLRYLWGSSLQSAGEAPELMFPWMVMAGVVLAAQHGAHISITWFVDQVPPAARRVFALLNCAILVVGYSVLAYGTSTLLPVVHEEHSHVLGVPASVTYSCMLAGFVFLVITTLTQAARMLAGATVDATGATGATSAAASVPSASSAPSSSSVPSAPSGTRSALHHHVLLLPGARHARLADCARVDRRRPTRPAAVRAPGG